MKPVKVMGRVAGPADALGAKCLACGYDSEPGEEACAACGSSLDLKLCIGCEAINARRAERCHACGAQLAEPANAGLPALRFVLAPRAARRRQLAALIVLPLVATAAFAYYIYRNTIPARADTAHIRVRTPAADASPAAMPKQAASDSVPTAVLPARAVRTPSAPLRVAKPVEKSGAAAAALLTKSAAANPPAMASHPRVTHTKAAIDERAAPVATAKDSAPPVRHPDVRGGGCSEAVTVLGLCNR